MTKQEKTAYEAGKHAKENGYTAPCFDPIMEILIIEPRSESGRKYVDRILAAWYAGNEERSTP